MSSSAHFLTVELGRLDEGLGLSQRRSTASADVGSSEAAHVRVSPASNRAAAGDVMTAWCRHVGASHRQRDESAQQAARTIQDRDDARQIVCRRRWPAIVAAMRTLIDAYNEGTGSETLLLVDHRTSENGEPTVTVTARSGRSLVMAIDGADLWVRRSQDEHGATAGERWIGIERSDEGTAAYVLQHWLTQL